MKIFRQKFTKIYLSFTVLISSWLIYTIDLCNIEQYSIAIYAGFLAFIGQVGLEIVIASLTFLLWERATGRVKTVVRVH